MYAAAKESQLKLIELTGGYVMGYADSFLGFRHGPKVMIDDGTLLVYLFSNNKYEYNYEKDLVNSVDEGERGKMSLGITEDQQPENVDHVVVFSEDGEKLDEDLLMICQVLPAQIIGFFKSLQCGLSLDAPSKTGAITREVKGVTVYPFRFQKNGLMDTAVSDLV